MLNDTVFYRQIKRNLAYLKTNKQKNLPGLGVFFMLCGSCGPTSLSRR